MEVQTISESVSTLGFPIAIALYFVWQNKQQNDKFIELARQASADSTASTEAIKKATSTIERNTEVFNRLVGVLESRK